jgi:hypothetical protein
VRLSSDNIIEEKDPAVLYAALFRDQDARVMGKKLVSEFKYSTDFGKQVSFLMQFANFDPRNVSKMKKAQGVANISSEQITKIGEISGLDPKLAQAFNQFENTVSGNDFPDLKGAAIGQAKDEAEYNNFMDIYNKL